MSGEVRTANPAAGATLSHSPHGAQDRIMRAHRLCFTSSLCSDVLAMSCLTPRAFDRRPRTASVSLAPSWLTHPRADREGALTRHRLSALDFLPLTGPQLGRWLLDCSSSSLTAPHALLPRNSLFVAPLYTRCRRTTTTCASWHPSLLPLTMPRSHRWRPSPVRLSWSPLSTDGFGREDLRHAC